MITDKRDRKLPLIFATLVLAFGLAFMFAITPLSPPDEEAHYRAAYLLSNVILQKSDAEVYDADYHDFYGLKQHYNVSSGYDRVKAELFKKQTVTGAKPIEYDSPLKGSEIAYIPQAMGISLARLFDFNFITGFEFGRFFNLLFFVLCVGLAVKITPVYKLLFGVISLLPMSLQQASSFSYDSMINGLAFILIALILRMIYQDEKIRFGQILSVFIVSFLLTPLKLVYIPLVLLTICIPKAKFVKDKGKIWFVLTLIILCIADLAVVRLQAVKDVFNTTSVAKQSPGNFNYSFGFIIHNFRDTVLVFINTLNAKATSWIWEMLGSSLCGLSLPLPKILPVTYILMIFFSAVAESRKEYRFNLMIVGVVLSVCSIGLIMLSMFLGWTVEGSPIISGIQGRYFLPLAPLFGLVFGNCLLPCKERFEKRTKTIVILSMIISNATTLAVVYFYTIGH